ncbi:unnamed protein product [Dicrocoelium dendriticum]|nr:unnamed protein product [Dicrocoelium dendriticum]
MKRPSLFLNSNFGSALALICLQLRLAVGAYLPGAKYAPDFYYEFSEHCQRPKGPQGVKYYPAYSYLPSTIDPNYRVLSVATESTYNVNPEADMNSETLEVYVVKGRATVINITAPNLRSFSVIDTNNLAWGRLVWNFPKLRVLNLITVRGREALSVSSMGSKELEILRVARLEYTDVVLTDIDNFKNLRILELSQIGFSTIKGACELIGTLTKLEHLFISQVNEVCLTAALKKLADYGTLRTAHIFETRTMLSASDLCTLFPPRIEILRMTLSFQLEDTRIFNCYHHIKLIELQIDSNTTKVFSTQFTSLSLYGTTKSPNCSLDRFVDVDSVRVMKLRQMFSDCHQTPHLPNVEILQFTYNGFHFSPGVPAFPGIPKVRILDLSGNPIGFIPPKAFDSVPLLGILVLQSTNISGFGDSVFCNLQWPRVINFHLSLPTTAQFRKEVTPGVNNSFRCFMENKQSASIVASKMSCTCPEAQNMYLPESVGVKYLALDQVPCQDDASSMFLQYVEENCPPSDDWSETGWTLTPSRAATLGFALFWVFFALLACAPAGVLYHIHCRKLKQSLIQGQLQQPSQGLFIICPRHARSWCRKVIIPCLEADLFSNSRPRLRNAKFESAGQNRTKQRNQHGAAPTDSPHQKAAKSGLPKRKNVVSPAESEGATVLNNAETSTTPKPTGPWAWQPKFHCHLAPPARHRLQQMMESKYVLIIFPSTSLFTEPACRAQLRLAFHLTRLHRIPPPAILLWPMSKSKSKIAGDYRSVNRNTNLLDQDKYYPTPEFNTVTNDPEDVAETATIKAKVPTREEAVQLLQYFSTTTSPCIEWNNSKTASANLKPLVWLTNKQSRIAAY